MKHKKTITSVALILLGVRGLQAQENSTAAGGQATGTGGTASYSLGQVVYTTATGTNGSIAQGVQQPYKISTVGISETAIDIELAVYPNPTTDYLQLKVDTPTSFINKQLRYQLVDLQGKVIAGKNVNTSSTTINMQTLPKATYFLRVSDKQQKVKTFKIIKQ